jgi:outer membrane lipoprotein-sorting protein
MVEWLIDRRSELRVIGNIGLVRELRMKLTMRKKVAISTKGAFWTAFFLIMMGIEPSMARVEDGQSWQWQESKGSCDRPAREILEQMEDLMRGESSYSEMTMRIVRPRYTREMSIKAWQKGGDSSMILVTAPARDKGTAFLMHDKDIWNYDPRIDRTTRLPSSMMSQSWMGSDFTNDDLVRESDVLEDYTYMVDGEEMIEGELACRLEMIPKPDAPVVWGRVLLWVSAEGGYQLRVENYDQRGELAYTMVLDDIRELGGRTIPTRFTMQPAGKEGEYTEMTYRALQFDVDLEDSFFRRSNMERLQ